MAHNFVNPECVYIVVSFWGRLFRLCSCLCWQVINIIIFLIVIYSINGFNVILYSTVIFCSVNVICVVVLCLPNRNLPCNPHGRKYECISLISTNAMYLPFEGYTFSKIFFDWTSVLLSCSRSGNLTVVAIFRMAWSW